MKQGTMVAILVVLAVLLAVYIIVKRRNLRNTMISYIQAQDIESFELVANSFLTKFLFLPFDLDSLKLNASFIKGNKKEIDEALAAFDRSRLSYKQKQDIYMKGFNYYLSIEDKAGTTKFLDKIHELDNAQMNKEFDRVYDIYILKGHKFLDEMIDELDDLQEMNRGVHEFLISLMYQNMGEKKKANEYHRLSEKHMAMLDNKISKKLKQQQEQKKHK